MQGKMIGKIPDSGIPSQQFSFALQPTLSQHLCEAKIFKREKNLICWRLSGGSSTNNAHVGLQKISLFQKCETEILPIRRGNILILVGASLALEAWACPGVAGSPLPPLSRDRHHGARDLDRGDDYYVDGGDRCDYDCSGSGDDGGNSCFHSLNSAHSLFMKQKVIFDCKNDQVDKTN